MRQRARGPTHGATRRIGPLSGNPFDRTFLVWRCNASKATSRKLYWSGVAEERGEVLEMREDLLRSDCSGAVWN